MYEFVVDCITTYETATDYVNNSDPEVTRDNLSDDGFSFYNGTPVFSADWLGTSAVSFGVIVIGSDNLGRADFTDTLMHEYGHAVHFKQIGAADYLLTTALPSLAGAAMTNAGILPHEYYYDMAWERTADYLGGVDRGYLPYSNTCGSLFWIATIAIAAATRY